MGRAIRRTLPAFFLTGAAALFGLPASAAGLDGAIRDCRSAPTASDRVAACNLVIARVADSGALSKAYNRRGLANVELGRYAEAARDFTEVIRFNPEVAGYRCRSRPV